MIMKYYVFIFLVFAILGCKKEKNNTSDLSKISDVIGSYYGDYNHEFGWTLYNPTIVKSNNNTLLINYWPSGPDSIFLKINGNQLSIEEQTFDLQEYSLGQGILYKYKLKLTASGTFENNRIVMSFIEEIKNEGDTAFIHKDSGTIDILKQ